ncbi:Uncharacterised protein [uncultured archaeon]|nr:Uncharacterised protein [uncultured archaeon]
MDLLKEVYCQTCGGEILDHAYVSDMKKSYHSKAKCIPKPNQEDNRVDFRTKEELQEDIRTGKLIHYEKLERTLF